MYTTSLRLVARVSSRHASKHTSSTSRAISDRRFLSSNGTSSTLPTRLRPRPLTSRPSRLPTTPPTTTIAPAPQVLLPESSRRHYGCSLRDNANIAIIGGGLTGLTTAWYLTRAMPKARITIYELGDRLGGWINTEKVEVKNPEDGSMRTVHFEKAARMVKPQTSTSGPVPRWDDLIFFDMVTKLKLKEQLMYQKTGEETVSGFIYYPDHLVGLPVLTLKPFTDPLGTLSALGKLVSTLFEPVFRDLIPGIFNNFRGTDKQLKADLFNGRRDVSIGKYYASRMGGRGMVDKVLSAMIHGITGGDVWKLSMASGFLADHLVPTQDQPVTNAPVRIADYEMMKELIKDKAVFDLAEEHLDSTALWFRNGFSTLTDALAANLQKNPNVTIKLKDTVIKMKYSSSVDVISIYSPSRRPRPTPFDKVVSTIPARVLDKITGLDKLPSLKSSKAVTIMLVNIWYPVPQANFPNNGFGYLIPQAIPFSQNPECILGCIFDSDREFPLPTAENPNPPNRGADTVQGTKLTVMMGGHYWDGLRKEHFPTPEEAKQAALAAVQRHLNLPPELAQHAVVSATLHRSCIPQHLVGHQKRMKAAHAELEWGFKGRLAVAGQSYQNPGVLGMLRAGRDVAMQIAGREQQGGDPWWSVGDTGLERFLRQPKYVSMQKQMLPLRFGSGAYLDEGGEVRARERPLVK